MTSFVLDFGDRYGDGHERSEKVTVTILSDHSQKQLVENFERNVTKFGYYPELVADGYENGKIDLNLLLRLIEGGMELPGEESMGDFFLNYDDDEPVESAEDVRRIKAEEDGAVVITVDGYVLLIMFLMGDGLDGFTWKVTTPPSFFELAPTTKRGTVGYGLF